MKSLARPLGRARSEDPSLDDQIPHLMEIIALRNRLAHGYSEIDDAMIWSIVEEEIPDLISRLEELWPAYGDGT